MCNEGAVRGSVRLKAGNDDDDDGPFDKWGVRGGSKLIVWFV